MKIQRILFLTLLLSSFGFSWPFSWLFSSGSNSESPESAAWLSNEIRILKSTAGNIDENVLKVGLKAYQAARKKGLDDKGLLTVIDYSKPSSEKRMWVFDVNRGVNLYNTWVTHGKNSGDELATSFSNQPGSLKSSIGVFTTANDPYVGKNGYSLRLNGLEPGVNDNAFRRAVVIHGAWYANPATIVKYGQLGRSWGCPAVSDELSRPLINTIKDHTLVVAYYPDPKWMSSSSFLMS